MKKNAGRGEGAHGGHVIGHTRSGRPIYAASHAAMKPAHAAMSQHSEMTGRQAYAGALKLLDAHPGWTSADHKDASDQHFIPPRQGRPHPGQFMLARAHDAAAAMRELSEKEPAVPSRVRDAVAAHWPGHPSAAEDFTSSTYELRQGNSGDYAVPGDDRGVAFDAEVYPQIHGRHVAEAAAFHHRYFPSLTANEHLAVANVLELHNRAGNSVLLPDNSPSHGQVAEIHRHMAESLSQHVKKHEGSRGGHIIGHTRSGKPIYRHDHASNAGHHPKGFNDAFHHGPIGRSIAVAANPEYDWKDHAEAGDAHIAQWRAAPDATSQDRKNKNAIMRVATAHSVASQDLYLPAGSSLNVKKSLRRGEGTRGGHVVGHTRSGQPIYAADSAVYQRGGATADSFPDYTAQDHRDAYNHHDDTWRQAKSRSFRHGGAPGFSPMRQDNDDYREGQQAADVHQRLMRMAKSEGSHGGHVIGHTRSGKPVYLKQAAKHYTSFSPEDHDDAGQLHVERWNHHVAEMDKSGAQIKQQASHANFLRFEAHHRRGLLQRNRAGGHETAARKKRREKVMKSEGSHGGHVIGHTRGGHAIYAPGHAHYTNVPGVGDGSKTSKIRQFQAFTGPLKSRYAGFSPHDHTEAAKQHLYHAALATQETDHHRSAAKPEAVNWGAVVAAHTKRLGHEHASLAHFAAAGHENPYQAMQEAQTQKSLAKSEGSRGGRIVGHTRSGRAIYQTQSRGAHGGHVIGTTTTGHEIVAQRGARNPLYDHFTPKDHAEASNAHIRTGSNLSRMAASAAGDDKEDLFQAAAHHTTVAGDHYKEHMRLSFGGTREQWDKLGKSRGEGSRGGKIIGHDQRGRPVYARGPAGSKRKKADSTNPAPKQGDGAPAHVVASVHGTFAVPLREAQDHISQVYELSQGMAGDYAGDMDEDDFDHEDEADNYFDNVIYPRERKKQLRDAARMSDRHFPTWTASDHDHAANLHSKLAAGDPPTWESGTSHSDYAGLHKDMAAGLRRAAKKLAKSGEGSHGGHVIGHTRSGKPIYGTSHSSNHAVLTDAHRQNNEDGVIMSGAAARHQHLGFTKQDHIDAADHHADIAASTADYQTARDSHVLSQAHAFASMSMRKPKDTDSSPGDGPALMKAEGARGGHVIGHTKAGKPIYQSSHGTTGRISYVGVKGFTPADHADAITAHTALLSSGLPEEHAAGARRAIAYHQKKSGEPPAPKPPKGIQNAVAHPGSATGATAPSPAAQNPTRALTGLSRKLDGIKVDEAAFASGQYRKDRKALDVHALKAHDQHFAHMSAEDHMKAAQDLGDTSTGQGRERARVSRTAHATMAHALLARHRDAAKPAAPPPPVVIHGLPPRAPQATAKSTTAMDLEGEDSVTVETPADTIKLVDRLVQNMRLAGLDVEVEGTSSGGYSIRRRMGGQPVEIRPDGIVRAPEALVLFALGDDLALAKAGIAVPGVPAVPKPPAMPAMPKVATPKPAALTAAAKTPGNAVLGKTHTGGTVWAHAKADSPVYRAFGPRDHAQAANLHQLAGNHAEAGAHRAMHAKLTAPKAPAMSAGALAARPKMGIGRLAHSDRREPDMVKWESQDVLGDWLGKARGEGSRGGHIIGHTRSGKPIYGPPRSWSHETEADHELDHLARQVKISHDRHQHLRAASKPGAKTPPLSDPSMARDIHEENVDHFRAHFPGYTASDHADAAARHRELYEVTARRRKTSSPHKPFMEAHEIIAQQGRVAKSEGSRGGHIIGHTRSGKAIYAADSVKYRHVGEGSPERYQRHVNAMKRGYRLFTPEDHQDAIAAHARVEGGHEEAIDKLRSEAQKRGWRDTHWEEMPHHEAARQARAAITGHSAAIEDAEESARNVIKAARKNPAALARVLRKAGLMSMFHKPKLPAMPALPHPVAAPAAPAAAPSVGGHAGEGSKGGQVVGHTQSGKAIYSAMHANNYKKFSMGEHSEASMVHGALAHAAHVAGNKELSTHHSTMRLAHVRSMQRMSGSPTMATGFNTGAPVRQVRARRAAMKKPAAGAPAATQTEA